MRARSPFSHPPAAAIQQNTDSATVTADSKLESGDDFLAGSAKAYRGKLNKIPISLPHRMRRRHRPLK